MNKIITHIFVLCSIIVFSLAVTVCAFTPAPLAYMSMDMNQSQSLADHVGHANLLIRGVVPKVVISYTLFSILFFLISIFIFDLFSPNAWVFVFSQPIKEREKSKYLFSPRSPPQS